MEHNVVFSAFIVNSRDRENHAENERGALLEFPTDTETVKQTFQKLGLSETAGNDDYIIERGERTGVILAKLLSQSESIDELNYLATRIAELNHTEAMVYETALEVDGECGNVRDAINLTYNTECYEIIADMDCWENVGAYFAEQAGLSFGVVGELADYIDYEAYGKDCANKNGGTIVGDIYIESGRAEWTDVYDGDITHIPREYAVTPQLITELEQTAPKGMYEIYQLKDTPELHYHRFEPLDRLHKNGLKVEYGNYNLIYSAELKAGETPETLFEKFNTDIPQDFKGHSMSVSDIVVIKQNEREQAYYCDRFGFREVPEFLSGKENCLDAAEPKTNKLIGKIDKRFFKIDLDGETHIFTNIENVGGNKYIANAVSESGQTAGYYSTLYQSEIDRAVISENLTGLIETKTTEQPAKPKTITVLVVQPSQEPHTEEIGADLKSLQNVVGGNIEVLYPYVDEVGLICNEEGKNERLELNRALYDADGEIYDIIAGTFIVVGLGKEDFCSLSPEQIKTYSERLKSPEMFVKINDQIRAIPVKPSIKRELKKLSAEKQEPKPKQKQHKPPNTELE